MDSKGPMKPRDAYEAYLKGDLTPTQAESAVQHWYATSKPAGPKTTRED